MIKTACILGATGLVGHELLTQLLNDSNYEKVKIFIRREIALNHPKLEKHLIDFDDTNSWKELVTGDVLFSAFGTTINKAGSKEAQYKIDFTYQYEFAKAAAQNGVRHYVLVSSAGAKVTSTTFYARIKGELEEAVRKLTFNHLAILRPSLLDGDRKESRIAEQIGLVVARALSFIPIVKKYKPIKAHTVAQAMIKADKTIKVPYQIWELNEINLLANV